MEVFGGDNTMDGYIPCCYLLTHPRHSVFLSAEEILQLYDHTLLNPRSYAIVLSPRNEGVKALCVRLTQDGFRMIEEYYEEGLTVSSSYRDVALFVAGRINQAREHDQTAPFYCQVEFRMTHDPCIVAHLRDERDEMGQLTHFIREGNAEVLWIDVEEITRHRRKKRRRISPLDL